MDYSVIAPKAEKKPGGPPPRREVGPRMGHHVAQIEQLSRIRRLNSIDLIHSRCLRMNFNDHFEEDYGPHGPPMSYEMDHLSHHGYPENDHGPHGPPPEPPPPPPPPPSRYMLQGPPPPAPRYMLPGPPPPPLGPPPSHPPSPPRYMAPSYGPPRAPPPPDYYSAYGPPPPPEPYYPHGGIFSDENPNGCIVM